MKKFALVTLAMGATLAFIPSALGDSLGYQSISIDQNSNAYGTSHSIGFTNNVAQSGALAMSGMIATFSNQNLSATTSETSSASAQSANVKTGVHVDAADGSNQFNSLLNFGNAGTGILDKGGLLVDLNGRQLTLLAGGVNTGSGSLKKGQFFFSDKGSFHPGNSVSGNNASVPGRAPALAETPEPGSLVLLGTGLLCMALVLFWKSAKRPATAETLS